MFEHLYEHMEMIDAKIDGAFNIRAAGFMRRLGIKILVRTKT